MTSKITKYICLLLLLFVLLVPFLKQHTGILHGKFEVDELKGYFPPVDSAHFSLVNWMDGSYQKKQEEFLKRDLKIRPYAVRVNNQLHYNALGEIRRTIAESEDGYLFDVGYIYALQGKDFIGTQKIKEQSEKLQAVAEYLKEENDTDIIVAVALDKARFFKEKIPSQYDLENVDSTNYETYLEYLDKEKIHFLDFNKYFLEQKNNSEHKFATKQGVHWSLYGGLIAADSILSYVGKLKGKEVNRLDKSEITKTTEVRKEDDDIGKSMNMYYPLEADTFSYFEHYLFMDKKPYRPNIGLVGDSFCWTIWGQDIPHHYWGDSTLFMYYYNQVWDTKWELSGEWIKEKQKLDFAKRQDVIVLLFTPMNMNNLGGDFIDDMYDLIMVH